MAQQEPRLDDLVPSSEAEEAAAEQAPGLLGVQSISVAPDGSAWAVHRDGTLFQYAQPESRWHEAGLGLALSQVAAVDLNTLWGLDSAGGIHRLRHSDDGWSRTQVSGKLSWISASGDGTAWGVTSAGDIHRLDGESSWSPVALPPQAGAAVRVSVADDTVLAVTAAGDVLKHADDGTWTPIGAGFTHVSALPGGAAYALDGHGCLCLYVESWIPMSGRAVDLSAASPDDLWIIDDEGAPVHRMRPGGWGEHGHTTGRITVMWDAEDPFDERKSTHLWIVNRGAALAGTSAGELGRRVAELVRPFTGKNGESFHDNLCQGLYDADFKDEYNGPALLGQPTYASHFYDPTTGHGWYRDDLPTAVDLGVIFFYQAADQYRAGFLDKAGYSLGLALHFLTDLTQPMHSSNFSALSLPPLYHGVFEELALLVQAPLSAPASYVSADLGGDPARHLIAAARNSREHMDAIRLTGTYFRYEDLVKAAQPVAYRYQPILLREAVQVVAHFLVAWMRVAIGEPGWNSADQGTPNTGRVAFGMGAIPIREKDAQSSHPIAFVRGDDGHLWINWLGPAGWKWVDQGPASISAPLGALSLHDTREDRPYVFYKGYDGRLRVHWWDGSKWRWNDQGTPPGTGVADGLGTIALAPSPREGVQPYVALRGTDGGAWLHWWSNPILRWTWTPLGHPPGTAISSGLGVLAVTDHVSGHQHLNLYVLGTDGQLWLNESLRTGADPVWTNLGKPSSGRSIIGQAGTVTVQDGAGKPHRPYVFVVTDDGHLWVNWRNGDKNIWSDQGMPNNDPIAYGLGAVTVQETPGGAQNPQVFVTDALGSVWCDQWDGSQWHWVEHGTLSASGVTGPVGVFVTQESPTAPQRPHLFVLNQDGHLITHWYE